MGIRDSERVGLGKWRGGRTEREEPEEEEEVRLEGVGQGRSGRRGTKAGGGIGEVAGRRGQRERAMNTKGGGGGREEEEGSERPAEASEKWERVKNWYGA